MKVLWTKMEYERVSFLKGYTLSKNWEAMARRAHHGTFLDVITVCTPVEQYTSATINELYVY